MNHYLVIFSLTACALVTPQSAPAETSPCTTNHLIETQDGSSIFAQPTKPNLLIQPWGGESVLPVAWSNVNEIKLNKPNNQIRVSLHNGDQITGDWIQSALEVRSSIGSLNIPTGQINRMIQQSQQHPINIALGKPVSGQDGASHGKGLAKHITDGDTKTHAKPPASHFDYTVTLSGDSNDGHHVSSVKIHWGRFGDRFNGVPSKSGSGWASAAWPGEYITSYTILYRTDDSNEWKTCHSWQGRPVDENAAQVTVKRHPTDIPGCSSESSTTLSGLNLDGVTAMRIQAKGSHWIGLHELEIFDR